MNFIGEEKNQGAVSLSENTTQPVTAASASETYYDHDRLQKDDTLVTTDDDEE